MRIEITTDVAEFRSRTEPLLLRDPLRHTVISTAVADQLTGLDQLDEEPRFVSVHAEDAAVVGAAMRMPGRDMYLGELPSDSIAAVVHALSGVASDSGGVEGTPETATPFAQRWCDLLNREFRQSAAIRLYRLGALRIPNVAGSPRRAMDSDTDLCVEWVTAMCSEVGIPGLAREAVRARIGAGRWWLWELDGAPVSLAAHQVPVHGWSRIGPVCTPPEHRGHGYASAVSAHVAQVLREDGLNVCLFADTANPTSNRIYQAIGFHPTHEFVRHEFL